MRIRMKSRFAGAGGNCEPGKVIDLPTKEAKELIDGGFAEKTNDRPDDVETAAVRTKKPSGKEDE